MAVSLTLTIGVTTATLPINATNAQVSAALTRYARAANIPITGVAVDDMMAVLKYLLEEIKSRSKQVQMADDVTVAQVAAQAKADIDNPF